MVISCYFTEAISLLLIFIHFPQKKDSKKHNVCTKMVVYVEYIQ